MGPLIPRPGNHRLFLIGEEKTEKKYQIGALIGIKEGENKGFIGKITKITNINGTLQFTVNQYETQ